MKKLKVLNYSDKDYKKFINNSVINCNFNVKSDISDYKWVSVVEEYLPLIDTIIRNPRRYIQTDESLVNIEKAKKIGEESIKHLAQNTQLIQSIDKDGLPQPTKILNIYKEETYDLYENRFIATLINKLYVFITLQYEQLNKFADVSGENKKIITYSSKTTLEQEEYLTDLKIRLKDKNEKLDIKSIANRINEMYAIIGGFKTSSLMRELHRAEPVRSPIRKTNAILKDPVLNKCLQLWEILEQLQNNVKFDFENVSTVIDENLFAENLSLINYMNYCTLTKRVVIDDEDGTSDKAKNIFNGLIKIYIERPNIGINRFRKELMQDLDVLCLEYENNYHEAEMVYENFFNSFNTF